ncbi:homing endonuclease [Serratia phage 4S]|nr:homing endonuclease [Serratia phage 4S]
MNIVYRTTNLLNNKIYIGVHNNSEDNYLGSGNLILQAISKYGKENFNREILFEYEDIKDAYAKEAEIVDEEFLKRKDVYNLVLGGLGGVLKHNKGKPLSEERKEKIRQGVIKRGARRVYGKASEGSKEALRRANKARTHKKLTTPVTLNGITYENRVVAASMLGVTECTIMNRLKRCA